MSVLSEGSLLLLEGSENLSFSLMVLKEQKQARARPSPSSLKQGSVNPGSYMNSERLLADLGTPLAGFGALLFIASDAMIAISKFRGSFLGNEQLIWITYYSAQLLILGGVQRRNSGNQCIPLSQSR